MRDNDLAQHIVAEYDDETYNYEIEPPAIEILATTIPSFINIPDESEFKTDDDSDESKLEIYHEHATEVLTTLATLTNDISTGNKFEDIDQIATNDPTTTITVDRELETINELETEILATTVTSLDEYSFEKDSHIDMNKPIDTLENAFHDFYDELANSNSKTTNLFDLDDCVTDQKIMLYNDTTVRSNEQDTTRLHITGSNSSKDPSKTFEHQNCSHVGQTNDSINSKAYTTASKPPVTKMSESKQEHMSNDKEINPFTNITRYSLSTPKHNFSSTTRDHDVIWDCVETLFTDKSDKLITDGNDDAVFTDKHGNPVTDEAGYAVSTDSHGRPIYTDSDCNPITDRHGNAVFTDKCQNPITDRQGNAVFTDKNGNPITDRNGKAVPTDRNHRPVFTDQQGHFITDNNGNAIYTDKAGRLVTDHNGMAVYNDSSYRDVDSIYTYSDGKPITDDKGRYVYTDSRGNPILRGTTPMKSQETSVNEDLDYVYDTDEESASHIYSSYDDDLDQISADEYEEAEKMTKCIPKKVNNHSILCVCNHAYCDKFLPLRELPYGEYLWVTSTRSGLRFQKQSGQLTENKGTEEAFFVNYQRQFQNILGFGGTFTDSASVSIKDLDEKTSENLLKSYFGFFGIHLTMGRVPIGTTNFSELPYTYMDHSTNVENEFMLAEYDFKYKIPLIERANNLSQHRLKLIASAWTAPKWMKEVCNHSYADALKRDFWPMWAQYHIKFLDQYERENVNFWALTTGSEPMFKYHRTKGAFLPSMSWSPYDQQQWVAYHLALQLRKSRHNNVRIFAFDDNREYLPFYTKWFFENFQGKKYKDLQYFKVNEAYDNIYGIALHWYTDTEENLKYLDWSNELYPKKHLLYTESCCVGVTELGSWDCAERYAVDIIMNLNHWVSGWIDWNLALGLEDQANWETVANSPIIIDYKQDEFYKQPTYYVLGHFSKFILPGSFRVEITPWRLNDVSAVAAKRPDKGYVVVFYNKNENEQEAVFVIDKKRKLSLVVAGKSINSVIFW